jgi:hypothetical protein
VSRSCRRIFQRIAGWRSRCSRWPALAIFAGRPAHQLKDLGLAGDLDCLLRVPVPVGQKLHVLIEPGCCLASREATAGTVPVFPKDARTAPPWHPFRLTLPRQTGQLAARPGAAYCMVSRAGVHVPALRYRRAPQTDWVRTIKSPQSMSRPRIQGRQPRPACHAALKCPPRSFSAIGTSDPCVPGEPAGPAGNRQWYEAGLAVARWLQHPGPPRLPRNLAARPPDHPPPAQGHRKQRHRLHGASCYAAGASAGGSAASASDPGAGSGLGRG